MLGAVGGPLIFVSAIFALFGAYEQNGFHAILSIPEGALSWRLPLPDHRGVQELAGSRRVVG
jgi:hypothetical protein